MCHRSQHLSLRVLWFLIAELEQGVGDAVDPRAANLLLCVLAAVQEREGSGGRGFDSPEALLARMMADDADGRLSTICNMIKAGDGGGGREGLLGWVKECVREGRGFVLEEMSFVDQLTR